MSREVCGICWCPYDEITGECACKPEPERRLTDEVIADLWYQNGTHHHHFARAIERWLKGEK